LLIVLISVSCATIPTATKLEIPPFPLEIPERPVLVEIPLDTSKAIEVLTKNMGLLINYSEKLETYAKSQENYINRVITELAF